MRKRLAVAVVAFVLGAGSQVRAQAPASTIETDIKCFVVAAALASSADNSVRGVALISSMYFMGRIDTAPMARDTVAEKMEAVIREMDEAAMRTQLKTCSETMRSAGNKYRMIGDRLRERPAR
jgi:hypothetical protein